MASDHKVSANKNFKLNFLAHFLVSSSFFLLFLIRMEFAIMLKQCKLKILTLYLN